MTGAVAQVGVQVAVVGGVVRGAWRLNIRYISRARAHFAPCRPFIVGAVDHEENVTLERPFPELLVAHVGIVDDGVAAVLVAEEIFGVARRALGELAEGDDPVDAIFALALGMSPGPDVAKVEIRISFCPLRRTEEHTLAERIRAFGSGHETVAVGEGVVVHAGHRFAGEGELINDSLAVEVHIAEGSVVEFKGDDGVRVIPDIVVVEYSRRAQDPQVERIVGRLVHDGFGQGESNLVFQASPLKPVADEHVQSRSQGCLASIVDESPGRAVDDRIVLTGVGEEGSGEGVLEVLPVGRYAPLVLVQQVVAHNEVPGFSRTPGHLVAANLGAPSIAADRAEGPVGDVEVEVGEGGWRYQENIRGERARAPEGRNRAFGCAPAVVAAVARRQ